MVMKNKNEIREVILVQEKDEKKEIKIKTSGFSSQKLVNILNIFQNNLACYLKRIRKYSFWIWEKMKISY